MLAVVRRVAPTPHLEDDLQRLLEPLEALFQRRERYAQCSMLALVPGGSHPEERTTAG